MNNNGLKGEGGVPLAFNKKLTEEFRRISGNKFVQVGWNGHYKMWNLLMKGKYIMSMSGINSYNKKRVHTHFVKLRSNGYDNVKRDMARKIEKEEEEQRYQEEQFRQESVEIGIDMLVKQKESVYVGS